MEESKLRQTYHVCIAINTQNIHSSDWPTISCALWHKIPLFVRPNVISDGLTKGLAICQLLVKPDSYLQDIKHSTGGVGIGRHSEAEGVQREAVTQDGHDQRRQEPQQPVHHKPRQLLSHTKTLHFKTSYSTWMLRHIIYIIFMQLQINSWCFPNKIIFFKGI